MCSKHYHEESTYFLNTRVIPQDDSEGCFRKTDVRVPRMEAPRGFERIRNKCSMDVICARSLRSTIVPRRAFQHPNCDRRWRLSTVSLLGGAAAIKTKAYALPSTKLIREGDQAQPQIIAHSLRVIVLRAQSTHNEATSYRLAPTESFSRPVERPQV